MIHTEFLKLSNEKYADLWKVLCNTGMRVGEAMGLLDDEVVFNSIPSQEKWIFTALKDKTELYGYILLKAQSVDTNNLIIDGLVKRAPLKKRKRIAPQFNRVIPLINLDTANTLQKLKKNVSAFGLLFEGYTYREFYREFVVIRNKFNLKNKDIHSVRHTFATRFTKLCDGDPRLAEKVLGHSDAKMTMRYNHLASELDTSKNSQVDQIIKPLKF